MARIGLKSGVNINRVIVKIVATVLGLWVGGFILQQIGATLKCTYGPFYSGLKLIGYTVTDSLTIVNSTVPTTCNTANSQLTVAGSPYRDVITSTTGTGVLAVVGIVAIASIVTEFVQLKY